MNDLIVVGTIAGYKKLKALVVLAAEAADNGLLAPELAAGIVRVRSAKSVAGQDSAVR